MYPEKIVSRSGKKANPRLSAAAVSRGALSGLAILLGTVAANAADLNTGTDPGIVQPGFDPVANSSVWNGAYAGVHGDLKWRKVGVMGSSDIDMSHSPGIGGYIGYNQEIYGPIIGGLEVMGGYSGKSQSKGGYTVEQDWDASLRARMGYALEQNLFYGLAGVKTSRVTVSNAGNSDTNWMNGWTVGAGVERQLTDNIIGRIEYDYSRFGKTEFETAGPNRDVDLTDHGIKLGVGLKF
ncbi:outer membrane protein [Salaquimonas pukyongi]|uniref:outer membrane protein n=1 Tax=Salaquimonas pukyongi TaxID=2712698 RepID=UPI00096B952B|nr:outer membrane protein [Salaquimonas pukyongi]